jgi:hypothetical protein
MSRSRLLLMLIVESLGLAACQTERALHVASAFTAHQLCAQAFVARQPVPFLMRSYVQPMIRVPLIPHLLRYQVEPVSHVVQASVAGAFQSRAQYVEGRGCTVLNGSSAPMPLRRSLDKDVPAPALPVAIDPALNRAMTQAFTPDRRAIVVLHGGRIVAEHYAAGYTVDTRLQSWSMAKSVTNALVGVLVRQGRSTIDAQVAGLPEGVTVDRLLRQTSGQPFGSSNSGFDRASRMQFLEPDTAAYAATAFSGRPGDHWSYTDANYAYCPDTYAGSLATRRNPSWILPIANCLRRRACPRRCLNSMAQAHRWAAIGPMPRRATGCGLGNYI